MTDTTDTPRPGSGEPRPRRRRLRPALIAAAVAAVALFAGIEVLAHGGGRWHRAGLGGAPLDPAAVDAHLDRVLGHLAVEIGATDAQRQELAPIVKGAARDLLPVRERMRDARRRAVEILSQDSIDRSALEVLRAEQLALAEQASRRVTEALADAANVLTPAQRRELAERLARRYGPRG
jgi:Spy/CpxP family protein refolding chaperone